MADINEDDDGLSPLAIGYMWSSRIFSISIEMGLIVLGFHWLDKKFGTSPLLIIIGGAIAFALFFVQILSYAKMVDKDLNKDVIRDERRDGRE